MALALSALLIVLGCSGENENREDSEQAVVLEEREAGAERVAPLAMGPAEYVTSSTCRECHATQVEAWTGSHHDRAMEVANEATVLGDFSDVTFEARGESWRFFRRDGVFMVNALGPDGVRSDFEIQNTFGVDPLQQYLVALPGGRLHALTVAWDTRVKEAGGQRWFALYPEETTAPGDVLHWTGAANRWNSMCAHCHSTNLEKNFDLASSHYATSWSEIDVACEACHGPASLHLDWARAGADPEASRGFENGLGAPAPARWIMNPETGIARREPAEAPSQEIDACSGCHARRSLLSEDGRDARFLDRHMPALLEEGLYFPDGQIRDEVYVYGSFLQSKMYRAGVRCRDCHEPHSLEPRASGDALCAQCHAPEVFAVRDHHQHPEDSPGARCVECHMTSRTYMVVDDRRDHSFRIPRPDLTLEIGSPNACTTCHRDRDAAWAAEALAAWPSRKSAPPTHFGRTLFAGFRGIPGSQAALMQLATDAQEPAIARATAVSLLSRNPDRNLPEAIRAAVGDADPLVRLAATRAVEIMPLEDRVRLVGRLLSDPVRAVRIEAARTLAGADLAQLGSHLARAREPALAEYRLSQELDGDRPSAHVNLALLAASTGQLELAESEYQKALEVGAYFLPTYVNYADLLRGLGREEEGEKLLLRGLEGGPDSAELHHSLGLLRVRLGRAEEATDSLRRASDLAPGNARFAYVLGVALYSGGDVEPALQVLRDAHERHPTDLAILEGLASISREAGHLEEAAGYAERLSRLTEPAGAAPRPGSAR